VETVKPPPAEGFEVTVRSEPPQLTAAIRDTVPRSKLCLLLDEVRQYVRSFPDAEAGGSLTVIWHGGGSRPEGPVDIEVAVPLQKEIPGNGRVQIGFLPELKLSASLVHHCDPYQQVCSADAVLSSWLASSQIYTLSGTDPIREVYLTPDEDIYGSLRLAELQVPLMPRP
jgi:effector-binding domain-containing protein